MRRLVKKSPTGKTKKKKIFRHSRVLLKKTIIEPQDTYTTEQRRNQERKEKTPMFIELGVRCLAPKEQRTP